MQEQTSVIKAAMTGVFAFFTTLWGTLGWLVVIWLACMALDYISGSVAAKRKKNWSSAQAHEGLAGKGGMILFVLGATLLDLLLELALGHLPVQLPFTYTMPLTALVLCWYIITEIGSIFENAEKLGAHWPPFLQKILQMMKKSVHATGQKMLPGQEEDKRQDEQQDEPKDEQEDEQEAELQGEREGEQKR
ncbi:phage holin family protein [Ruminococcaceae bacterium OttesenSCG-928-I18]|nr:phage holin family protein [Ruminococcaceae bacterium OttesenSCG-928-I18]